MSIFSKRHYVWLASAMRDVLHDREANNPMSFVSKFADQIKDEAPDSFDKPRFMHNVFCAHDHDVPHKCPFDRQ